MAIDVKKDFGNIDFDFDGKFLKPLDKKYYKHVLKVQYFNSKDWDDIFEKNKWDIWFRFFILKKDSGKTTNLIRRLWEIDATERKKVMVGRLTKNEMVQLAKTINNNPREWPFKVKGNEFYSLKNNRHCGGMFYLKGQGLQPLTSQQYPDYEMILLDECQPVKSWDEDMIPYVRAFIRFCNDLNRNKKHLLVELYGNNNNTADGFMNYFNYSFDMPAMIDVKRGILVINADFYKGLGKTNRISGLLDYDEALSEIFRKNISVDNAKNLIPKRIFDKYNPTIQFCWNSLAYWVYFVKNYMLIKSESFFHEELPIFAVKVSDLDECDGITLLNRLDNCGIIYTVISYIMSYNIGYDNTYTKQNILKMVEPFVRDYQNQKGWEDYY